MNRLIIIPLCVLLWCHICSVCADETHRYHQPADVVPVIDSLMNDAVVSGLIPGGVVCVTDRDTILYIKAYGNRQVYPDTLPMTIPTMFDLASLSKSTSTAMCVFALVAEQKLQLNDNVSKYIPQITDSFTIAHLLTHTSGLPSYLNVSRIEKHYGEASPKVLLDTIAKCARFAAPGKKYRYSCLNFILLQHIVQNIENKPLSVIAKEHVFLPLGMTHTCYLPDSTILSLVAPTELMRDSVLLHGQVHDPLARVLNLGISGNAGVFSCAEDLAHLGMFLLTNKDSQYVHEMTSTPDSLAFSNRTLGWDKKSTSGSYAGDLFGANTYCHTGYTGTSMAIDPDEELCLIILTNRVHPNDKGNLNPLRRAVSDAVMKQFANENDTE